MTGVFVVWDQNERVIESFPHELLDVDTTNLPAGVLASLEEAIQCHAVGCYRAAAIMVRRTLEEVCADQAAEGKNLKMRITALGSNVVLPAALLTGLDGLRLLGNDAAHLEAQVYDQIGQDELELAIEVVKMVLLSLYQTSHVVARLQALQKTP